MRMAHWLKSSRPVSRFHAPQAWDLPNGELRHVVRAAGVTVEKVFAHIQALINPFSSE